MLKALEAADMGLEVLNLSGNSIGQSSFFEGCSTALVTYLEKNQALTKLILDNNMLRGKNAEKIIKQIGKCVVLTHLSLAHNFLGQK